MGNGDQNSQVHLTLYHVYKLILTADTTLRCRYGKEENVEPTANW